jgi:predicted pyridoxine 5'-phosphate oxidase superfamily flavin-nucleotide-binding protein
MPRRYNDLAFTPHVKALQERRGSRGAYARQTQDAPDIADALGPDEREFIEARDSFYLSTVTETGWPYVQHRGGPIGFVRVVDDRTLGFADLAGNRQYISLGNLATNDRAALFFMDYPAQTRLKILAHAKIVERDEDPAFVDGFAMTNYRGKVERAVVFTLEGFSWNCQQHITPRFTLAEIKEHRICAQIAGERTP